MLFGYVITTPRAHRNNPAHASCTPPKYESTCDFNVLSEGNLSFTLSFGHSIMTS